MLRLLHLKKEEKKAQSNLLFYRDTASMTKCGGWQVDLKDYTVFWDDEVRKIHAAPSDYIPDFNEGINFFTPEYRDVAKTSFEQCKKNGVSFDLEMQIQCLDETVKWIRTMGNPVYDGHKIVGVRGIFQDIQETKSKEVALQHSLDLIASQNEQLLNFAHIVSHNLRSHSSNLELVLELLNTVSSKEEKTDILSNLKDISINLSETITHLNEVLTLNTSQTQKLQTVNFEDHLLKALAQIDQGIMSDKASINADFSALPTVLFTTDFMESILLNLISNALKYCNPNKPPIVTLRTFMVGNTPTLTVTDNGLGIDLDMHGDKVFGMYKTFHKHPEAKGIGLFIIKNQIEALEGKISVESTVGTGSTFTIKFKDL